MEEQHIPEMEGKVKLRVVSGQWMSASEIFDSRGRRVLVHTSTPTWHPLLRMRAATEKHDITVHLLSVGLEQVCPSLISTEKIEEGGWD
jgi:hypothetical protein